MFSEWRRGTCQWILITVSCFSLLLLFLRLFSPCCVQRESPVLSDGVTMVRVTKGSNSMLNTAFIHFSHCPVVCRCWSSHVEQRERSSTSPLPAGAHSSLENQVSPLIRRRLQWYSCGPRITHFVSGDRPEVFIYLVICVFFPLLLSFHSLSVDTQCAGGETVTASVWP